MTLETKEEYIKRITSKGGTNTWKDKSPEQRSMIMGERRRKGWAKISPEERSRIMKERANKRYLKSNCCEAPVIGEGNNYTCTECKEPCELYEKNNL